MFEGKREEPGVHAGYRDARESKNYVPFLGHAFILIATIFVSQQLIGRLGMDLFVLALIGIFFGTLYAIVSLQNLMIPFMVWVLSIGGFRYIWSIQTPVLPDLYLDRMMMIWLCVFFMLKFFAERWPLRPPFLLDTLLVVHGLYLLVRVLMENAYYMNPWSQSYLIPYAGFFFAKNILITQRQIRTFLWGLFALTGYYTVTAVAEKMDLTFLIWPKVILTEATQFRGRSVGPFLQAPLFGTVLGMLVPLNLYFFSTVKTRAIKSWMMISLALGMAGLYFTYTRGSWLAGFLAMVTTTLLNARRYGRLLLPAFVIVPLVSFAFLGLGDDSFMKKRVENEDTLGSRFGTAATALRIWRDNPVFGVGFFQYRKARVDYIQPVEIPGLGAVRFSQFRHNNIHDIYLGPLAEDGIIGMGLQVWIYAVIFTTLRRKYAWRHDGDHFATYIIPVFGGLFVGYLVGGLAIDYRFFSFVGALFYMCAGILYGYQKPETENVS